MDVLAVLIAAGEGKRWDGRGHKLLAPFHERPLLCWAIDHAVDSGLEVLVVYGAIDYTDIATSAGARAIENPDWKQGQATSLALTCDVARSEGRDAIVVGLGDQPLLHPSSWTTVANAPHDFDIVVATYEGQRGHPVRLSASTWPLLRRTGDQGARLLMSERPDLVRELACRGNPADIDTLEDLNRWS